MEEKQIITMLQSLGCSDGAKQQAFTALHSQFNRRVGTYVGFLLHRSISDPVVRDIVEDCFVKAFLSIGKFSPNLPWWPWMKKISHNTVIDWLRKNKRSSYKSTEYNEFSNPIRNLTDSSSADSFIIENQTNKQVTQYLYSLPQKHRRVMELRFFQDKSYNEISCELGVNIKTISTIILRCRVKLKAYLNCL